MTKTEAQFYFRCFPLPMLKSPKVGLYAPPGNVARVATQEWTDVGR